MEIDDRPEKKTRQSIELGADLSTLSVDEINERVSELKAEIERLEGEKQSKSAHLVAAQSFFKSPTS